VTKMAADGETAPRLGEQFRLRCRVLIKNLGYTEKINRKYGIDLGVDPSLPAKNLRRPPFSPNGRTAIDFKEGITLQADKEATKLQGKINTLNNAASPEFSAIKGGIIVADTKIGKTSMRKALDRGIFCWDSRYTHFLAKKNALFAQINNKDLREEQIGDWTTFFRTFESFQGFLQLKAFLFYHNPLNDLTAEVTETILQSFVETVKNYDSMKLPIIVHLQLHSIAEVTEGGEERFAELTSASISDYAKYERQQCWINGYHLAPWFVYCKETCL
jgi:hypothetical protein